jgi:glycosyltransferase involved in cell wall biosynthesis
MLKRRRPGRSESTAADGILALIGRWREQPDLGLGQIYHLAGTGEASWFEFATAIFRESAGNGLPSAAVRPIRTADWPTRAARPANSVLDSRRFASEVGYRAPLWQHSLAAVVAELRRTLTMRVTAFTRYGAIAASTRQRLLQYLPRLAAAGIQVDYHPLLPNDYVRTLGTAKRYPRGKTLRCYLDRVGQLIARTDTDVIWVYAELFPYLPAGWEKLAFRSGKPVVYDCDDAFFHTYDAHPRPWVRRQLGRKLEPLLRGAAACCCGNSYLESYAARFSANTLLLPTVVDTEVYGPAVGARPDRPVTIGWIGTPSTWPYVRPLLPLLRELVASRRIRIRVVGAGQPGLRDAFPGLDLIEWSEAHEVEEVRSMDIGIMPLPDDIWARGKCGYKLVQYMACALPVVASPVGVNSEIVADGSNGFLATDPAEWRSALLRLIDDPTLRRRFGEVGRGRVEARYSLDVHAPRFIRLLQSLA